MRRFRIRTLQNCMDPYLLGKNIKTGSGFSDGSICIRFFFLEIRIPTQSFSLNSKMNISSPPCSRKLVDLKLTFFLCRCRIRTRLQNCCRVWIHIFGVKILKLDLVFLPALIWIRFFSRDSNPDTIFFSLNF